MFAQVLQENIRGLGNSDWKRTRNPGAPFIFGENHLRKQIRSYTTPPGWPHLVVERKVENDFMEPGRRHGGVDYFFVPQDQTKAFALGEVLATCEVGGPTRPKLLLGSRGNWYPKIVADIRKQLWRANAAPNAEHYLGLLIKPLAGTAVRKEIERALKSMLEEVPGAQFVEASWTELSDVKRLNVVVMRVIPKRSC